MKFNFKTYFLNSYSNLNCLKVLSFHVSLKSQQQRLKNLLTLKRKAVFLKMNV